MSPTGQLREAAGGQFSRAAPGGLCGYPAGRGKTGPGNFLRFRAGAIWRKPPACRSGLPFCCSRRSGTGVWIARTALEPGGFVRSYLASEAGRSVDWQFGGTSTKRSRYPAAPRPRIGDKPAEIAIIHHAAVGRRGKSGRGRRGLCASPAETGLGSIPEKNYEIHRFSLSCAYLPLFSGLASKFSLSRKTVRLRD